MTSTRATSFGAWAEQYDDHRPTYPDDPALAHPEDTDPMERLDLASGSAEQRSFRWTWTLTPAQWRGFVSTVSHVALLPEAEREAALDETERLVTEACEAAGVSGVPLDHDAVCIRWSPHGGAA